MARITIDVKESKLQQLLDYLKKLDYVKVEKQEDDITVPESHQKFVLDRIATAKPEDYISLEEAQKRIKRAS